MKKFMLCAAALLLTLAVMLPLPVYAEEIYTEEIAPSETVTETVTDTAETVNEPAETVTEPTESQTSVPFDDWLYDAMKQATPEQMEMVEKIVMGGVNALDKLGIRGFDRVRVWVEYNTSTVMVIALAVALVAFLVASILQKKGFAKKADILNANAIEMYEAGQEQAKEAHAACRAYADRADKICRECAEAAKEAAESAKAAQGQVTEERALLVTQLERNARVNAALCETVNFLLQCSDLSQSKRDEAEAIYKRGLEAMEHDDSDQA